MTWIISHVDIINLGLSVNRHY